MKVRILIFALFLLGPMILTQNCAKTGSNTANSVSPSGLTDAAQAPQIQCQVQSPTGSALLTFGNSAGQNSSLAPIVTGASVKINCAQSVGDVSTASQLNYTLTDSNGNPAKDANGNLISFNSFSTNTYAVGKPGKYGYNLLVSDPGAGTSASVAFSVYVQCSGQNTLAYSGSGVSVASTSLPNFFNYSISAGAFSFGANPPAGVGANPSFSYAIDFNGDGVVDPADLQGDAWSSPTAAAFSFSNIYNAYINVTPVETRQVHVLAMDNSCFYTADSGPISLNFNNSSFYIQQPVTYVPPTTTNYYYIQADVAGLNGLTASQANGHILYTKPFGNQTPHVVCSPTTNGTNNISFAVTGVNTYDSRNGGLNQSLSIHFSKLNYPTAPGQGPIKTYSNLANSSPSDTSAADGSVIDALTYTTIEGAGSEGSYPTPFSFQQGLTNCTYQIQVERFPNGMPCNDGSGNNLDTMRYYGSFKCDDLRSSNSRDVSAATNGFFFCEANLADACIGGGGGGGGGIPPFPH